MPGRRRWGSGISALALLPSLIHAAPAAASGLPPSEWVVGPDKRVALITFDGQTKPKNVLEVVTTLEGLGARASFFFSGSWVAHHDRVARLVRAAGHALGNRGYGTARFTSLSDDELRASIARAQEALNRVGAHPRPFLRAPDGARDLRVLAIAGSLGYRSVRWTQDPGRGRARKLAAKAVRRAQAGTILSLDIWRNSHRRALGPIVEGLRQRGFELRTIENLERVHPIRWDVTLRSGSTGPEAYYLQKKLSEISYPAGRHDSSFGYATLQAVYAFEKVHRMTRDGVVPPSELAQIARGRRPRVTEKGVADFVEVDVSRQVLFEVKDRRVRHTLPVSSGNEETYTVDGESRTAHTPRGAFEITRKIPGWRESDLGQLWYPSYFVGGYAIHGSTSVPTYPASHGCIRIPMYVTRGFYARTPVGLPVFVHD